MSWGDSYACPCSNCGGSAEYKDGLCRSCYAEKEQERFDDRVDDDYEAWRDDDE
mgnify:CR=1 FL=1|jgi:hypothetical protein